MIREIMWNKYLVKYISFRIHLQYGISHNYRVFCVLQTSTGYLTVIYKLRDGGDNKAIERKAACI